LQDRSEVGSQLKIHDLRLDKKSMHLTEEAVSILLDFYLNLDYLELANRAISTYFESNSGDEQSVGIPENFWESLLVVL